MSSAQASAPFSAPVIDCLDAVAGCASDPGCEALYRVLEYCASEEAVSPLGPDAGRECLEARNSLQQYRPLLSCKCHRGSRMEEACLRVYWNVRFSQGFDEYDSSPYEDFELELVRHIEMSRMASIVAASSLPPNGQNQCLKAAQDCGLYEKCGSLRSEYVLACTKRAPGSDHCNRQKCHRALRRFLERVPEEYSFGVLFCPCTDTLCGERRRKTIVPSCSYEERNGKPNCLSLQSFCLKDELCRSRLADFQHNCQPSTLSPSGCLRESGAVCLKAYAGLIGEEGGGFGRLTGSRCRGSAADAGRGEERRRSVGERNGRNAISALGSLPPRPVESTPPPPPRPSPRIQQEDVNGNALPELSTVSFQRPAGVSQHGTLILPSSEQSAAHSTA
ncbi:GDNF family receptor alpha-4-like [Scleropages formosus]|uniref:GDNF family receptor alpha-4-like n=1 Tax=Scleropages formosus TaxID=113540 RepID=A0A0P7WCW4_SCLFO|nr:GDNF family receptor alpha-4-like [Scleropages formosus]